MIVVPDRSVEYIRVPKCWFGDAVSSAMVKSVRPPTSKTRRKRIVLKKKVPAQIFWDLLAPFESNEIEGLVWNVGRTAAQNPTKATAAHLQYHYHIRKPGHVDRLWRLEERELEKANAKRIRRRGHGAAKLHLSLASQERGERSNLLAQVTGNISAKLTVCL
jgi:hypothetical protein